MFHPSVPYGELIARVVLVYLGVLLLLRLGGKRQIGQMSPTEFVAVLLISNAVQNAMNGGDNSLSGGLVLSAVLVGLSWLISLLTFRSKGFRLLFEGAPTLLVHSGKVVEKNLRRERITPEELRVMIHRQGVHSMAEIASAVLEADGNLVVTRRGEKSP